MHRLGVCQSPGSRHGPGDPRAPMGSGQSNPSTRVRPSDDKVMNDPGPYVGVFAGMLLVISGMALIIQQVIRRR
jgi:hypothetical protein